MHLISALTSALLLAAPVTSAVAADPAPPPEVSVPFGCGLTFPVSQAHSVGSHQYNDVYAWDFRMPEGTPVVAAADGVVRMARGDSSIGGCDPEFAPFANYVVVTHANGIETQYLHFREVLVKPGDKVKAGDLLGYSGKTGWACGAHLHFKVAKPESNGWNNPSIPARIAGYGDPQAETLIVAPACKAANDVKFASAPTSSPSAAVASAPKQDKADTAQGASASAPAASSAPAKSAPASAPAKSAPAAVPAVLATQTPS